MSPKILFANTYFYRLDEKQWRNQKPYPPYGTILAAALMREAGFLVELFDCSFCHSPKEIESKLTAFQPDYLVVYDDSFNYLSKMCLTVMREACFEMMNLGKTFGCKVLVNSSDATDHTLLYLQNGADIVMKGEAEVTLKEVVTKKEQDLISCLGISFLKNNELINTSPRPILTELDLLPLPAWDLIEIDKYWAIWMKAHGYFSLNIATTRGCPFKCNWCAKPVYGNRYNVRSAEAVVSELKLLMTEYGANHFWVCDDIFGLKPLWVKHFSQLLQSEKLHPKLKIQCRADLLLKENTITDLVAAGLDEVWMGAESGSQQILDAMDKGTKVEQIAEATQLLKKHGVKVCFFLQYGYLGESMDDIHQTLAMVQQLMPHDIGISVSYPLPGTGFYDKVKAQLQAKQNWTDSDDLAVMYNARYSSAFYRQLYHHTHRIFLKRKSVIQLKTWLKQPFNFSSMKIAAKLPFYYAMAFVSAKKIKQL